MPMKKSVWDIVLKAIIAVASAVLGALGAHAMNLQNFSTGQVIEFCEQIQDTNTGTIPLWIQALFHQGDRLPIFIKQPIIQFIKTNIL